MTDRPDKPRIHVTDRRGENKPVTPAPPKADAAAPSAELEETKKLADDRLDQLMRLKADFENFRKRELREKTELIERASFRVVEKLLPVLDDFERAINAIRSHTDDDAFVRGLDIVLAQLHTVMEDEGLERVMAEGPFDPHEHEAVSSIRGDVKEPTVLEVVRPGYKLRGKTIRPALVHVSVPKDSEEGAEG